MSFLVTGPYEVFNDLKGDPLEDGKIYIGTVLLNPETNPINIFWDEALSIPAAQPIRTIGGYPSQNGTPANLYIAENSYSITLRDKNNKFIYSDLGAVVVETDVLFYDSIADMTSILKSSLVDGQQISLSGYYVRGDGGGDDFYWDESSATTENGINIFEADEAGTGRWLRIYDILTFIKAGCVGDGTTDDTIRFQAALDFAGDLYGVDKSYLVSSDLDFSINTRLLGNGTLKVSDPTGFTTAIIHTEDKTDIEIEGWTFDWENDGTDSVSCLSFDGCQRVNIHHNKFLAPISSVSIASVRHRESSTQAHNDCQISHNYLEVDKLGVLLQSGAAFPGENTTITNNIINCITTGVGIAELIKIDLHEDNVVCSGNILDGTNASSCITAEEHLEEIVISGNTCRNSINGLDITGGQGNGSLINISITGNTIDNCTNGIILGGTTTSPFTDGLSIVGNTINNCDVLINGISWGVNSSPVIISGNTFQNFVEGIEMRGKANITGNTFMDAPATTLGAIRLRAATSGLINGNQFLECLIDISLHSSSGCAVIGNNFTSNDTDTPSKVTSIVLVTSGTAHAIQSNYFNTVATTSLVGSITGKTMVMSENTYVTGTVPAVTDGTVGSNILRNNQAI